ncbi:hypothetical protein PIB30_025823 [Stylosanthes scabra]|uniref:RRM domain-containing protein n=1 Tax=Stylosanthes scabra TaxID=79078 RepID=A0ABU6U901_9FABA|nr:hypothetical protein [Stylosanthes scabra]
MDIECKMVSTQSVLCWSSFRRVLSAAYPLAFSYFPVPPITATSYCGAAAVHSKQAYATRQNKRGTFAFVRFNGLGGALKAVENTNGMSWQGNKLMVTLSGSRSEDYNQHLKPLRMQRPTTRHGRRVVQKWEPVVKAANSGKQERSHKEDKITDEHRRKEVVAVWAEDHRQLLQRSLLGVCVKPIKLRRTMNVLLENWNGMGNIEVRDVGPYRCLVTFSSPEIRDSTMEDELLHSVFDEVRHHWNTFWCLSRRVWIEVIGMPILL